MSFAYLALFTGDYLRDTRHLSPQKHGVYLLLLMYCWDTRGPAPLDEQECAGVANCRSTDEIESLRYVLDRYFVRMEDGWYNPRMQRELEKVQALSEVWSEAGKRGAQARLSRRQAKAKPRLRVGQAEATTPSPSPSLSSSPQKGEALASDDVPSPPPVVLIPLNDGTEYPVSQGYAAELETLYPEVDVLQTLREIRGWNLANPTKRKTRAGILRHVDRWMARIQNA